MTSNFYLLVFFHIFPLCVKIKGFGNTCKVSLKWQEPENVRKAISHKGSSKKANTTIQEKTPGTTFE